MYNSHSNVFIEAADYSRFMLLSKLESNRLETSIFLPSVSFHSSRIFLLRNSFVNFSYNFKEP